MKGLRYSQSYVSAECAYTNDVQIRMKYLSGPCIILLTFFIQNYIIREGGGVYFTSFKIFWVMAVKGGGGGVGGGGGGSNIKRPMSVKKYGNRFPAAPYQSSNC